MKGLSGRQMEIEWPDLGITVRATLRDDKAPRVCDVVWNSLPVETIQEHGLISGKVIYCATPIVSTVTEWMVDRSPGDVYFFNIGQMFILVYGGTTEPLKVNKFAEIHPEDMPKAAEAGRKAWESNYVTHEPIRVIFRAEHD